MYFHKDVSELTLAECACLISITNNPSQYDPLRSDWTREQNRNRQLDVLDAMLAQEKIDQATYDAAKAQEVVFTNGYTNLGSYVGPQEEDEKPVHQRIQRRVLLAARRGQHRQQLLLHRRGHHRCGREVCGGLWPDRRPRRRRRLCPHSL